MGTYEILIETIEGRKRMDRVCAQDAKAARKLFQKKYQKCKILKVDTLVASESERAKIRTKKADAKATVAKQFADEQAARKKAEAERDAEAKARADAEAEAERITAELAKAQKSKKE